MKAYAILLLPAIALLSACAAVSSGQPVTVGEGPVRIQVPSSVRIVSLDGLEVDSPNLYQGLYELRVSEGEHTLVARYEENWNTQDDWGHYIRWPQQMFSTTFTSSAEYRFEHTEISSREQAERLAATHPLWLKAAGSAVTGDEVREVRSLSFMPAASEDALTLLKQQWRTLNRDEQAAFKAWLEDNAR